MGADFLYAATELPTDQPIAELEAKIRHILTTDEMARDFIADEVYGGALAMGDEDMNVEEMVDDYVRMVIPLLDGSYSRCLGTLEVFDKDGNPVVLWLTGEMSWGDSSECLNAMWAIQHLGERWWTIDLPEN